MAEYIRLDTTIIGIDSLINKAPTAEEAKVLFTAKDVIYSQQRYVADVQHVNQWISVKDRLPESEKDVLVWYRYTWGAGFTSYRFGISKWYSNIKRWYEVFLPKDIEVLYWQPLPEPPKDGDANG